MKKVSRNFLISLLIASSIVAFWVPKNVLAATFLNNGPSPSGSCPNGGTAASQRSGRDAQAWVWNCYAPGEQLPQGFLTASQIKENNDSQGWGSLLELLNPINWIAEVLNFIGGILLSIGALILFIAGIFFDYILRWTIVDMAAQINNDAGIGGGIDATWATLRDLANLAFIFVLLWAAIQTILELNANKFGTAIKNIIIVALLINFSLFFTKFVIDASNIAAIGFYNSIIAGAPNGGLVNIPGYGNAGAISSIIMDKVNIQSFFSADSLTAIATGKASGVAKLLTGVFGFITMVILSIVLLVASVMFAARFIILIYLLILSAPALIGYALPGMSGKFTEWWKALLNQAFFAPYFMLLLWVAIKLIVALGPSIQGASATSSWAGIVGEPGKVMGLILNFSLIIGFIIGALILSKKMASSTPGFKAVSAGVGAVAVGGAAMVGRQTIGRASNLVSEKYRDKLSQSTWGRSALWAANKGRSASFDVRAMGDTKAAKAMGAGEIFSGIGKAGGKDGFKKAVEDKAKAKADYAKNVYGQTDAEKALVKEAEDKLKNDKKLADELRTQDAKTTKDYENEKAKVEKEIREERGKEKEIDKLKEDLDKAGKEVEEKEKAYKTAAVTGEGSPGEIKAKADVEEAKRKLEETKTKHQEALTYVNSEIEEKEYGNTVYLLKERSENATKLREAQEKELKASQENWKEVEETHKKAAERRMEAYAKRVEEGPLGQSSDLVRGAVGFAVAGPLGGLAAGYGGKWVATKIGNMQGNKASARKIREEAKGKGKKDKALDSIKELFDEADGGDKKKDEKKDEDKGDEDKGDGGDKTTT